MSCANCYLGDMLNNEKYKDVDPDKMREALLKLPKRRDKRP